MSISLNNSISALKASNALDRTTRALARALDRLASGQAVQSPRDGVSAYSTGVRLESQIRGLAQASVNVNKAQGLAQTGLDAISRQMDILQEIRSLAQSATSSSLSVSEREGLNEVLIELMDEFRNISNTTVYEGLHLLNGSEDRIELLVGSSAGDSIGIDLFDIDAPVYPVTSTTVSFNTGTGVFDAAVTYAGLAGVDRVVVGDVDGDGDSDILMQESGSDVIQIDLNDGSGNFSFGSSFEVAVADLETAQLLDVDNDSDLDLVTRGSGVYGVTLNNGDGTFGVSSTYASGFNPATGIDDFFRAGDVDEDGDIDLLLIDNDGYININLNDGNGNFSSLTTFDDADLGNNARLDVGDIDGDGFLDLVASDLDGVFSVYLGNGDGTFALDATYDHTLDTAVFSPTADLVDVDGDGDLDLILASALAPNNIEVRLNTGAGVFGASETTTFDTFTDVSYADFDADGNIDLVAVVSGGLTVMFGDGSGKFGDTATYAADTSDKNIQIADINGDGVLDLVGASIGGEDGYSILTGQFTTTIDTINYAGDLRTAEGAAAVLSTVESALGSLESNYADLSASMSALNIVASRNLLLSENLSAARESIVSADLALEIADLVKNQILQQAQAAVLTQANSEALVALQLLDNL